MIKEGDATIIAYGDAKGQLPREIVDAVDSGLLWHGLPRFPGVNYGLWIPFAVFGVYPVDDIGEWCGCSDFISYDEVLAARLYHRRGVEAEKRALSIWMPELAHAGHLVAVDGFTTMKSFFRMFKRTDITDSVKRSMN